jgi:hypothetical protein
MLGPSKAKVDYIAPDELLKEVDEYLGGNNESKAD